jgi:uroporphyrin-III C-methyltransferase / precorrin-2 dehydrogenase / sirohydrochlorin ferrochelatase
VDYFPVFMDLRAQPCLVVGGGEVAARKAGLLLRAGARVRVVAPGLDDPMRELLRDPALVHEARDYAARDLADVVLVIAATNLRAVNAEVSRDARALRLPVNVVDDPELCSFIVPALVDRSPVLVAIATGGSAPVLARLLRGKIEALVPTRYGALAALSAQLRAEVQSQLPDVHRRRRFWEQVLEGEPAELLFRGQAAAAERAIRAQLAASSSAHVEERGEVYLIGAGPNDPELVSFRALRFLQRADLVVICAGVADVIVELARRDATRLAWPDALTAHEPAADGVMQRLAAAVARGERACVLAPGDAFREAPGRRFASRLQLRGLPVQVVPAIADLAEIE